MVKHRRILTVKKIKKVRECPVNLLCTADKYCPNFEQCYDLSHSWEIPYERRDDGLYVKRFAYRWDRYGNLQPMEDYHEEDIRRRIAEEWRQHGFLGAVPAKDACTIYINTSK